MKKYIYSLAMMLIGLASCTTWDDPVTENYGDGPSIAINVTATTDSAVTFTLTPAEGTQYYNFTTKVSDKAEELDAALLLKGSYDNAANVKKFADNATFTYTIKAEPNTTYQVYAVAASDKGIVGKVAVASATTTDANAPALVDDAFAADKATKSVAVTFDQNLTLGEGAVSAVYYKEFDWENPVAVEADSINVKVNGNVATFSAPSTPDGAYVAFSWAAGAFVDAKGNKCGAFTSTFDEEEEDFIGAWVHNANVPFTIGDSIIVAPKAFSSFKYPEEFKGEIKFGFDVYRIESEVKPGEVCVTFTSDVKTTTYKLTADQWAVKDSSLVFVLPDGIEDGDKVSVSVAKNIIYDACGNTNEGFTDSKVWWKYVTFTPTVADVLGTFTYFATLKSNGKTYNLGNFTISEYTGEDAEEGDIVINNLYLDDSEIYGFYDLENAKLYIASYQPLGTYEEDGETYGVSTYSVDENKWIELDITQDGIVSTDFALVYSDAEYSEIGGFEVPVGTTTFVKATENAARMATFTAQSKKYATVKNLKGTPRKVKQIRK